MKKIAILVVCSSLLLSSCSFVVLDEAKTPTVDKETIDTVSNVDPNVFSISGEFPEIGAFSGKLSSDRFYDEPTYDFIPSDEYGEIIPYVGAYRVYETPKDQDWHTEVGYSNYGFCTPDGKIVMDASNRNTHINYVETEDGFGYYSVSRQQEQKDDAPDEYELTETLIIPRDGSWCLKLNPGSWVTSAGGGYISVCDYPDSDSYEIVKVVLYDYDGNVVNTLKGIDNVGVFSQGLMMVSEWVDNDYFTYFINESGQIILGPYSYARPFNEFGITTVEDDNGTYLINTKGERLSDCYDSLFYEYSMSDRSKAVFSARHTGDRSIHDFLSPMGEPIASVDSESTYLSLRFPDNGDLIYYYTKHNDEKYDSTEMVWKRVSDGSDVISKEFGVSPNSYMGHDNCYVNIDRETKKAVLFDADGETIACLDDVYDILAVTNDNKFIAYSTGTYDYVLESETSEEIVTDTRVTHIYDVEQKKVLYSLDKCSTAYFGYNLNDQRFIQLVAYIGSDVFGGLSRYWLFDTKTKEIVFEDYCNIELYSVGGTTYINTCTENSATLYDENFNIIRTSYTE